MKTKLFTFKAKWLLVPFLFFSLSIGNAWGTDVTFTTNVETGSTSMSKGGVSISTTSGTFSRTDNYRIYANNSMTISSNAGITKVVFTISQNNFTANVGTYNTSTKTWTGDATSITFSASGGQVRLTKIVVTTKGSFSLHHLFPRTIQSSYVIINLFNMSMFILSFISVPDSGTI